MGFSSTNVKTVSMKTTKNRIDLQCKSGSGVISSFVDWGVIDSSEDKNVCIRKEDAICNPLLLDKKVIELFTNNCLGKKECSIKNVKRMLKQQTPISTPDEIDLIKECNK